MPYILNMFPAFPLEMSPGAYWSNYYLKNMEYNLFEDYRFKPELFNSITDAEKRMEIYIFNDFKRCLMKNSLTEKIMEVAIDNRETLRQEIVKYRAAKSAWTAYQLIYNIMDHVKEDYYSWSGEDVEMECECEKDAGIDYKEDTVFYEDYEEETVKVLCNNYCENCLTIQSEIFSHLRSFSGEDIHIYYYVSEIKVKKSSEKIIHGIPEFERRRLVGKTGIYVL